MTQHVPEDLLHAFAEGDLGEDLAVHIAEHLDLCPACATRAAMLEPLAPAFASVCDPVAPPGLADAILEAADRPEPWPITELSLGAVLLVSALVLAMLGGDPMATFVRLGVIADALGTVGRTLSSAALPTTLALLVTTLAACLAAFAVSRAASDRRTP